MASFSNPSAPNVLECNIEKSADLITASIAARARRLHPRDIKARAAYFNAEAERHRARFWQPDSVQKRSAFTFTAHGSG